MAKSLPVLKDNMPPLSDKEVLSLQKRIQAISTALQTIQLERAIMETRGLDRQMETFLRARRDAYVASLSPLRRIPLEIWEHIFLYIPNEVIPVSQVCRIWRRVAVGIPTLWPKELLVFLHPLHPHPNLGSTVYACLTRTSDSHGLSACLLNRKKSPSPSRFSIKLDLRTILRRNPFKQLYMVSEFARDLFGDDYLREKYWEGLAELVIDRSPGRRGGIPSLHATKPISLMHLHSLTRLTLSMTNRITHSNFPAPWQQLEYLHLDASYSYALDYISIIFKCQRLKTLILACHTLANRREPLDGRILVPHLETLTLIGHDNIAVLLTHLELPALKYLSLSSHVNTPTRLRVYKDSAEDIMRLIETSQCTIIELTLHGIHLDDSEIPFCFHTMPELRILRVADNGGMTELLACLRTGYRRQGGRGAPMHLVPKLTTLLVETNSPAHWPQDSFNAMCNLRRYTDIRGSEGNRLGKVRLIHRIRPFTVYTELSKFVRSLIDVEGIVVDVPYILRRKPIAKT